MSAVLVLFASAMIMDHVFGHMCALSPYQRGGIVPDEALNNVGESLCGNANLTPNGTSNGEWPCYQQTNDDERIINFIGRGAMQPMVVYKNEQHYNKSNPGKFVWNLWDFDGGNMKFVQTMGSKPDTDIGDLTDYQIEEEIPYSLTGDHYVIQTVYYTLSPTPMFCSLSYCLPI